MVILEICKSLFRLSISSMLASLTTDIPCNVTSTWTLYHLVGKSWTYGTTEIAQVSLKTHRQSLNSEWSHVLLRHDGKHSSCPKPSRFPAGVQTPRGQSLCHFLCFLFYKSFPVAAWEHNSSPYILFGSLHVAMDLSLSVTLLQTALYMGCTHHVDISV